MILQILVSAIAGIGAGLGTGLAGMSAAAVISPMLITFLGMDAYAAIGIALASDVLASAVSTYTYGKNKNLDLKNGIVMMGAVLTFTLVGSFASSYVDTNAMGGLAVFSTFCMGMKFLFIPVKTTKNDMDAISPRQKVIRSLIGGMGIGFICGFIGAGGGIMMLLILTTVLGYELKTAVGTSVFIMTFTALTGAISHFVIGGMPNMLVLVVCVLSTLLWARIAAIFANKVSPKVLNLSMGIVLSVLGAIMIAFNYLV